LNTQLFSVIANMQILLLSVSVLLLIRSSGSINHGNIVPIHPYPFIVNIQYWENYKPKYQCGGSIITSRHILTAAHCVVPAERPQQPYPLNTLKVSTLDLNPHNRVNEVGQTLALKHIFIHDQYRVFPNQQNENDVAILLVANKIDAPRINLPFRDMKEYIGKLAKIIGWGATTFSAKSNYLKEANQYVISSASGCYGLVTEGTKENRVCGFINGASPDKGDSGGPLFIEEPRGTFTIIGVASYLWTTDPESHPSVYASVPYYLDWIHHIVYNISSPY